MRGRGLGHQRKDGRWETEVTIRDINGSKRRQSVYGDTQEEMLKAKLRLLMQSDAEPPSPWKVSHLIDLAKETRWKELEDKTQEQYEWAETRIRRELASVGVTEFKPSHAAKFLRKIAAEKDLSGRSVQIHRNVLSAIFRVAVEEGWRDDNPLREIRTPVSAVPTPRAIPSEQEWQRIVAAEQNPILRDLWQALGYTGMRPHKEGIVAERSQLEYARDLWWLRVGESKTAAGTGRLVPLPDDLGGRLYEREGLLFATSCGTRYDKSNVTSAWTRACQNAGVQRFELRSLRNLALTRWVRAKLPQEVVKYMAGHTRYALTIEVYARLSKDDIVTGVFGLNSVTTPSSPKPLIE